MGRKQKLENALRMCVDCLNACVIYFESGKYPKSFPAVINNANKLLGQFNASCGSCESFEFCAKASGIILGSENEMYIDEMRGCPCCDDYKERRNKCL